MLFRYFIACIATTLLACTLVAGEPDKQSAGASFLIRVTEHVLNDTIDAKLTSAQVLESLKSPDSASPDTATRSCTLSATVGKRAKASFVHKLVTFGNESTAPDGTISRSLEHYSIGTTVYALVSVDGSNVVIECNYDATSDVGGGTTNVPPQIESIEIETTVTLIPGKVELIGMYLESKPRIVTIELLE